MCVYVPVLRSICLFLSLQTLGTRARVMVIKRLCHAVKVRGRRKEDKHVEYLVGAAPDVKSSRIDSLWEASLKVEKN